MELGVVCEKDVFPCEKLQLRRKADFVGYSFFTVSPEEVAEKPEILTFPGVYVYHPGVVEEVVEAVRKHVLRWWPPEKRAHVLSLLRIAVAEDIAELSLIGDGRVRGATAVVHGDRGVIVDPDEAGENILLVFFRLVNGRVTYSHAKIVKPGKSLSEYVLENMRGGV